MADESKPRSSRLLPGLVVGALLGGGAGGYAWFSEWQHSADEQQGFTEQADACEGQAQELRESIAANATKMGVLQARVEIARALAQLDERNFGTAKKNMAAARDALDGAKVPGADEVMSEIGAFRLEVNEDLRTSRATVLGYAEQLDTILAEL